MAEASGKFTMSDFEVACNAALDGAIERGEAEAAEGVEGGDVYTWETPGGLQLQRFAGELLVTYDESEPKNSGVRTETYIDFSQSPPEVYTKRFLPDSRPDSRTLKVREHDAFAARIVKLLTLVAS